MFVNLFKGPRGRTAQKNDPGLAGKPSSVPHDSQNLYAHAAEKIAIAEGLSIPSIKTSTKPSFTVDDSAGSVNHRIRTALDENKLRSRSPSQVRSPSYNRDRSPLSRSPKASPLCSTPPFKRSRFATDASAMARLSASDFEIEAPIGSGSFGSVYLARHLPTGTHVALKQIKKDDAIASTRVSGFFQELKTLNAVLGSSPYLIEFLGSFETPDSIFLVMEHYPGGDFFGFMAANGPLCEEHARFYVAEVVLALEALHNGDYVYRDLKPENMVLDSEGHIRLCDLGFVKTVKPGDKTYTLCGTPEYSAPEVVLDVGHGKEVDWWALGVLIYEMVTGSSPFASPGYDSTPEGTLEIFSNIIMGRCEVPRGVTPECLDLLDRLLTFDPSDRLGHNGADEIKAHPWFYGFDWEAAKEMNVAPPTPCEVRYSMPIDRLAPLFTGSEEWVLSGLSGLSLSPTDGAVFKNF